MKNIISKLLFVVLMAVCQFTFAQSSKEEGAKNEAKAKLQSQQLTNNTKATTPVPTSAGQQVNVQAATPVTPPARSREKVAANKAARLESTK